MGGLCLCTMLTTRFRVTYVKLGVYQTGIPLLALIALLANIMHLVIAKPALKEHTAILKPQSHVKHALKANSRRLMGQRSVLHAPLDCIHRWSGRLLVCTVHKILTPEHRALSNALRVRKGAILSRA